MNTDAIKDLLYRLADDKLIIGHRNSEWIGLGPVVEEDIAFASMAQDEVGHAQTYYQLLQNLGEAKPDTVAFTRKASDMRCCHLVEYPIGDYAFSLMRHYLFDMADMVRLEHLKKSAYAPIAELTAKLAREEKYHQLHARIWISQLGNSTDEANNRMQDALNTTFPMAFGLFEPTAYSDVLASEGVQPHEDEIRDEWQAVVEPYLRESGLEVPAADRAEEYFGGRTGKHSSHLQALLDEMNEVFAIDPLARW